MKLLLFATGVALAAAFSASADSLNVNRFDYFGPFPINSPLMIDPTDVNGKEFQGVKEGNIPSSISTRGLNPQLWNNPFAPTHSSPAVHMLSFNFENTSYTTPTLEVKGVEGYTVYIDGIKADPDNIKLRPQTHNMLIRYVSTSGTSSDSLKVSLTSDNNSGLSLRSDGKRKYTLDDVLHGSKIIAADISPDGNFLITGYSTTARGGANTYSYKVSELKSGRIVARHNLPI